MDFQLVSEAAMIELKTCAQRVQCKIYFALVATMDIHTVGEKIRKERIAVGITQEKLASLSGLSRVTIGNLESGKLNDLGFQKIDKICAALGINLSLSSDSRHDDWMGIAAQTASTSYKIVLAPGDLAQILMSGNVPQEYRPHIITLLDEAPNSVIFGAIKEAAKGMSAKKIMMNVSEMARTWKIKRFA